MSTPSDFSLIPSSLAAESKAALLPVTSITDAEPTSRVAPYGTYVPEVKKDFFWPAVFLLEFVGGTAYVVTHYFL